MKLEYSKILFSDSSANYYEERVEMIKMCILGVSEPNIRSNAWKSSVIVVFFLIPKIWNEEDNPYMSNDFEIGPSGAPSNNNFNN